MQCASQAVETLCRFRAWNPTAIEAPTKVDLWAIAKPHWVTPTLHWGQATMLSGRATLLGTGDTLL